jgi:uridine kinase
MVGDSTSDIEVGKRAGLKTILVRTGYAGLDGKFDSNPDFIVPNIQAAINLILHGHASIVRQLFDICSHITKARMVLIGGCARSGKSTVASVLGEIIGESGRMVHVVSLDGWLKTLEGRSEGCGVMERYDMDAVRRLFLPLITSRSRHLLKIPQYERKSRLFQKTILHSVGPDDLLVLEGVTALLDKQIVDHADVKIYVDVSDKIRHARLEEDYSWRGEDEADFKSRLALREVDEVPIIKAGASRATLRVISY